MLFPAILMQLLLPLALLLTTRSSYSFGHQGPQCPCNAPPYRDLVQYNPKRNVSSENWVFCAHIVKSTGTIDHYVNQDAFMKALNYLKDNKFHQNGISYLVLDGNEHESLVPSSQIVKDSCNALISIDISVHDRVVSQQLCPHSCNSVPFATLAPNDFENFMESELPLLCSLTKGMLWARFTEIEKTKIREKQAEYLSIVMERVFFRMIMECFEVYHWSEFYYSYQSSKKNPVDHGTSSFASSTTSGTSSSFLDNDQQKAKSRYDLQAKFHMTNRKHGHSVHSHHSNHDPSISIRLSTSHILPQSFYYKNSNLVKIARRKIDGLVVWIGSEKKRALVESQFVILRDTEQHGSNAIIGWDANDRIYSCRPDSTECKSSAGRDKYRHLPKTAMTPSTIHRPLSEGWRCAQRRPLRSLAHTLTLFDPMYVVMLDDDTFFNYPLFKQSFLNVIYKNLTVEPVMMGEFTGAEGPNGHLTMKGMFGGGSGYIIGKRALDALASYEARFNGFEKEIYKKKSENSEGELSSEFSRQFYHDWKDRVDYGDEFRSDSQTRHLSVLFEGLEKISSCRTKGDTNVKAMPAGIQDICVSLRPRPRMYNDAPQIDELKQWNVEPSGSAKIHSIAGSGEGAFVPLAARLVDFCVGTMAAENTCLHSDHSLGRCLLFAGYSRPHSVICHSLVQPPPSHTTFGMCFMAKECLKDRHVTCHRYKPTLVLQHDVNLRFDTKQHTSILDDIKLDYSIPQKKPFPVYSSMFDGNKSDTYM